MDGTLLIALAIVGFIALIVAAVTIKSQKQAAKRKSDMLDVFNRIVAEEQLTISQKEMLKHRIFGIDELKMVLIVVQSNEDVHYDIIQLSLLTGCHLKHGGTKITERSKSGKRTSEEHVSEIFLSLTLENKAVIDIPVYKELYDGILEKQNLAKFGERWQGIIRKSLIRA
ncbi:MAG: hypothetical protein EOP56_12995 [Sphingobacteriales bacterium]|nr:MAG: hypothetical protein EOP56_12995 [Sphingobacteriales bacterium]